VKTYSAIIVTTLVVTMLPAAALTVQLRPRPFKYVLRGGEAAVCLAFAITSARSLLLIASGVSITYPGDVWATVNLIMYSMIGLLLWSRVAQVTRHNARNRDAGKRMIEDARAHGVEIPDDILKKGAK
jgi:hypothetical protein